MIDFFKKRRLKKAQTSMDALPDSLKSGITDGYHTFGELYEHRTALFIALCKASAKMQYPVWRTYLHSDGTSVPGYFILGIGIKPGEQISYHLPEKYWYECLFAQPRATVPGFDGHTGKDVINRLYKLEF